MMCIERQSSACGLCTRTEGGTSGALTHHAIQFVGSTHLPLAARVAKRRYGCASRGLAPRVDHIHLFNSNTYSEQ